MAERVPLLAWAGVALAEAQGLELAICTYLVIKDPEFDPSTEPNVIAKRFDALRREPLGSLLAALYAMTDATTDVQRDCNALNRARIELAHHLFIRPTSVSHAQTAEGRKGIVEQLRSWAVEFNAAADMVVRSAIRAAERFGTDARAIFERARELGAAGAQPSSPAVALVGLEKTINPQTLDHIAGRLGIERDPEQRSE